MSEEVETLKDKMRAARDSMALQPPGGHGVYRIRRFVPWSHVLLWAAFLGVAVCGVTWKWGQFVIWYERFVK